MAGRKNLFEPVAEKLMLHIREGRLAPGEKMPSEHELCRHYSLSRSSIRKVLDYLEQRGLIRREPGVGSFVCEKDAGLNKPLTIGMTRLLSFSYASPIIPWVQRVAAAQNCHLLHADPHELNEEGELPFDAFLFVDVGGVSLARLAELSRRGFPIAVLNRDWPEVATFRVDFYEEAKRAVRLLQRLGLKKIGAIDGERFGRYGNQCRMTGYEDAISEGGGKPFKLVRDFDSLAAVDSIAEFIRETRPDALFGLGAFRLQTGRTCSRARYYALLLRPAGRRDLCRRRNHLCRYAPGKDGHGYDGISDCQSTGSRSAAATRGL